MLSEPRAGAASLPVVASGLRPFKFVKFAKFVVLLAPVLLGLADVGLVAELGHALGLSEELLGLVLAS